MARAMGSISAMAIYAFVIEAFFYAEKRRKVDFCSRSNVKLGYSLTIECWFAVLCRNRENTN